MECGAFLQIAKQNFQNKLNPALLLVFHLMLHFGISMRLCSFDLM